MRSVLLTPSHENLLKGIYAVGFKKPSKIQEKALPMLLKNPPQNLIGQSQSGTGKTAAFALDMLSRVDASLMTPQAICLAPSRELARQIQSVIQQLGQFTEIKTMLAVPKSWKRGVKLDAQILIGTPGTLVDMLSQRNPILDPKQIRVFVLDEADEMIQLQGLGDQSFRIKKMLPDTVQNVLFSATFPDDVQRFATLFAPEANQIFLKKEDVTVDAIKQLYLVCDGEHAKSDALSALYDVMAIGQSIVFCKVSGETDKLLTCRKSQPPMRSTSASRPRVTRSHLSTATRTTGSATRCLMASATARPRCLSQPTSSLAASTSSRSTLLSTMTFPRTAPRATSGLTSRRISTGLVGSDECPLTAGRTGRFGRKGCSVTFVHNDRSMDEVNMIMQETGRPMKKILVNTEDLDQLEAVSGV